MSKNSNIHVFTALFATHDEAVGFGRPQWEPEPGDEASDEEYSAWEDRNPVWPLKAELGCFIDGDFVEVIWKNGDNPDWLYLASRLNRTQVATIQGQTKVANTLILIDQTAIGGSPLKFAHGSKLTYHGAHKPSP